MTTSGRTLRTFSEEVVALVALRDDVEARVAQEPSQALAQEDAVLGDRYAHGMSA